MSAKATAGLFLAGVAGLAAAASPADRPVPPGAVARVGDLTLTEQQLDEVIHGPLMDLRMRENMLRTQGLEELIAKTVLAREAAARGTTGPALLKAEVEDKAAPTEAELRAYYEANKARFPGVTEAEAFKQIEPGLRQQGQRARQAAFVRELRQKYGVKVFMEPLRMGVDSTGAPVRGKADAPITIVEFSDFQCPFCRSVVATLKQLAARYPDKVRLVFRDFPIPSLHPDAPLAHEAARCAGEQGQFWPYHDLLFERTNVNATALKGYAADLKLDDKKFAECLDSGRARAAVSADVAEGTRLGVSGTPTFFINGTPLVGNVPLADFQRAIERELARTASTK